MSKRIIAKNLLFVISLVGAWLQTGCALTSSNAEQKPAGHFDPARVIGEIKSPEIAESSGIAASKCQKNVLWTHNDSGDEAFIYAIDGSGASLGTWRVIGAENIDWEDIATIRDKGGKCFIYIGEIGDNKTKRPEHTVYRVEEPVANDASRSSTRNGPINTAAADSLTFSYSDYNQDAETLMIHPKTGDIYVVTKRVSGPAGVYRINPVFGNVETQKAEKVAELSVPAIPNGFLTGGDISPDGTRMVICDYTQAYEYVLPPGISDFARIWRQSPETITLGRRKVGESIAYSADGTTLFATSEGRNSPVI